MTPPSFHDAPDGPRTPPPIPPPYPLPSRVFRPPPFPLQMADPQPPEDLPLAELLSRRILPPPRIRNHPWDRERRLLFMRDDPPVASSSTFEPPAQPFVNEAGPSRIKIEPKVEDTFSFDDSSMQASGSGANKPAASPAPDSQFSEFACPICFGLPIAATLTPCGHVMCGSCLFASVKTASNRALMHGYGGDALVATCPVCRATIPGWDGKGGGVIGLEVKVHPGRPKK